MIDGVVQEIFPDFFSLSISYPLLAPPTIKPHVYFALDISGSMSGSKIDVAKDAVLELIDSLQAEGIDLTLIAFDDHTIVHDTRKIGFPGMRDFCESLGPRGGTRFVNVFADLKKEITENNDKSVGILFLTDGCDNDGLQVLQPCMNGFQKWMAERNLLAAIHAIGLGSDHDANLLTTLIKFGTLEGTFQYVADFDEILSAVDVLHGLLTVRGGWGHIVAGANRYKISLPYDKKNNLMEGSIFLKGEDVKQTLKAELFIEGKKCEYTIKQTAQKNPLTPQMFNAFAREQLREVIDSLKAGGVSEANRGALLKFIGQINAKALEMAKMLKVSTSEAEKAMLPYCTSIVMLSTELAAILSSTLKGVIGNEAVARMYDLVFQGLLGGRIRRKFQKLLVEGGAFKKACDYVDRYGLKEITEKDRVFTTTKFELQVNSAMPPPGISITAEFIGKGKQLNDAYTEFGQKLGLAPDMPFMAVALVKKSPAPVKELFEKVLTQAWEMGTILDPDLEVANSMIERKYGETDKKVYCLMTRTAAMAEQIKPLMEKLKAQPALGIEGQFARIYLQLATDFAKMMESSKPAYHELAKGLRLGWSANTLSKLADLPVKLAHVAHVHFPFPPNVLTKYIGLKSLDGELTFDITPELLAMADEKLMGTPFSMPVRDAKMMFGGMLMQVVSQSETAKKAFEFARDNVEGIEISTYVSGLFGMTVKINLPGLHELLDMPQ